MSGGEGLKGIRFKPFQAGYQTGTKLIFVKIKIQEVSYYFKKVTFFTAMSN